MTRDITFEQSATLIFSFYLRDKCRQPPANEAKIRQLITLLSSLLVFSMCFLYIGVRAGGGGGGGEVGNSDFLGSKRNVGKASFSRCFSIFT